MIIECQRHLFDIPREVIFLNAAYMTPYTHRMAQIAEKTAQKLKHPWRYNAAAFYDESEATRRALADLVGVSAENIAFIPSASYGAATASYNMPVIQGQVILVLEEQFPSNIYEWKRLAAEKGLALHFVKTPSDDDWTRAILGVIDALKEQVAFAALPNVHWSNGTLIDLVAVSSALKKNGAGLVLDLSQSLGVMPTDMAVIDPDFMFSAGYKWMFGPYSAALLYVAERHINGRSLEQNWIAREGSEDFARLADYTEGYMAGARRFDMGERSNFMLMPLVREATRQLSEWGIDNIAESCAVLTAKIAAVFGDAGYDCIAENKRAAHILGVRLGIERGETITKMLREKGVVLSLRGDTLRLSPHLWLDDQDISRLAHLLKSN